MIEGHSLTSGIFGGGRASPLSSPKSEACALSASFFLFWTYLIAFSTKLLPPSSSAKYMARCVFGKSSMAPPRIKHSMVLRLACLRSIRSSISNRFSNAPPSSRWLMISRTAFSPTPFIPPIPKRIAPSGFTLKRNKLSFTDGPNTGIPPRRHSSIKKVTAFKSDMLFESTEAMNSAG
ncbi:MAG: Uncharacterised protein [Cryomorphaceae bacterium]|nr:MAG: Uncharacterised protein [Cryomorphaceae bacterium]